MRNDPGPADTAPVSVHVHLSAVRVPCGLALGCIRWLERAVSADLLVLRVGTLELASGTIPAAGG